MPRKRDTPNQWVVCLCHSNTAWLHLVCIASLFMRWHLLSFNYYYVYVLLIAIGLLVVRRPGCVTDMFVLECKWYSCVCTRWSKKMVGNSTRRCSKLLVTKNWTTHWHFLQRTVRSISQYRLGNVHQISAEQWLSRQALPIPVAVRSRTGSSLNPLKHNSTILVCSPIWTSDGTVIGHTSTQWSTTHPSNPGPFSLSKMWKNCRHPAGGGGPGHRLQPMGASSGISL